MITIEFLEPLTSEYQEKLEDEIQKLLTERKVKAKIYNNKTGNEMTCPRVEEED